MAGLSFYGWSFLYGISYSVTLATFFAPFFLLHCYIQVATVCTFILHYPVTLLTLPSYILSKYITELYPILILGRSIFSHCIKSKQHPQALKLTAPQYLSTRVGLQGKISPKKLFRKSLTVPKTTHSTHHYLNTLPKTYPTLINT